MAMAALTLGAGAYILYLARNLNFFYDEWNFIFDRRGWTLQVLFAPHNQHWSTVPVLIFKVLFLIAGIKTYLPYVAVVVVIHLAIAWMLFLLVRRHTGDWVAVGAAALFVVIGRGAEDILWAFQAGYDGSVLLGLVAMYVTGNVPLSRRRQIAAGLLLLGSIMSSSVGLFFLGALAVEWWLEKERRHDLWLLAGPLLAYAVWFALFFHTSPVLAGAVASGGTEATPAAGHGLLHIPSGFFQLDSFVPYGIGASGAALAGLSGNWGGVVLVGLGVLGLTAMGLHRAARARVIGAAAGLLLAFTLTGLGRAQAGVDAAETSRYVYVGAVFLLLALPLLMPIPKQKWRRWLMVLAVGIAVINSGIQLHAYAATKDGAIARETAELQTLSLFRNAPDLQLQATIDPGLMPQVVPRDYFAAVDALGSPVKSISLAELSTLATDDVNRALKGMFQDALRPLAAPATCNAATSTLTWAGPEAQTTVASGSYLRVSTTTGAGYEVQAWYLARPTDPIVADFSLPAGGAQSLHLPDTGKPIVWQTRITLKRGGAIAIC
jgi:hypothetical protein